MIDTIPTLTADDYEVIPAGDVRPDERRYWTFDRHIDLRWFAQWRFLDADSIYRPRFGGVPWAVVRKRARSTT